MQFGCLVCCAISNSNRVHYLQFSLDFQGLRAVLVKTDMARHPLGFRGIQAMPWRRLHITWKTEVRRLLISQKKKTPSRVVGWSWSHVPIIQVDL